MTPRWVVRPADAMWVLIVLAGMYAAPALASTLRLVSVAQPLIHEDFIEICDVPYSTESFQDADEVAYTCEPNAIRYLGEDPDEAVEDLNAASRFSLSLVARRPSKGADLLDTLFVTLDASRIDKAASIRDAYANPDSIIEATILCVRINAARAKARIKYVEVMVTGAARYERFKKIYAVETSAPAARSFDFRMPLERRVPPPTK